MTKDEIMELAAQAGIKDSLEYDHMECDAISLGRFYRLAYARGMLKQEEQYMQLFLDPENQPTQFGTATQEYREKEIQDEREAIADEFWSCVMSDLEHGVKSLNEKASFDFQKSMPALSEFGRWLNKRGEA